MDFLFKLVWYDVDTARIILFNSLKQRDRQIDRDRKRKWKSVMREVAGRIITCLVSTHSKRIPEEVTDKQQKPQFIIARD